MPKLTQMEIEKEAERIKKEYAYMDNMPLAGWMWEFVRRSPEYQEYFEKFRKLSLKENLRYEELRNLNDLYRNNGVPVFSRWERLSMAPPPNWQDWNDLPGWLNKIQMAIAISTFTLPKQEIDELEKFRAIVPHSKNLSKLDLFRRLSIHISSLPDYRIRYDDFVGYSSDDDHPVRLKRLEPYTMLDRAWFNWEFNEEQKRFICNPISPVDRTSIIHYMGLDTEEGIKGSVYVRISKKANERDLKKLLNDVKQYLSEEKHRVRDKEWKYYLIVYDLKKQRDYAYNYIADILNSAFPKKQGQVYDENDIKRHRKRATALIDKGNYREYLHY
jgi:hypothetical protein